MLKEILEACVDVLGGYSIAELAVKEYIDTETQKWDGYIPVAFDHDKWNKLHQKLKDNPNVNYDALSTQDILSQAEIIVRVPRQAIKHLVYRQGVTNINELAKQFDVSEKLIRDAVKKYFGV